MRTIARQAFAVFFVLLIAGAGLPVYADTTEEVQAQIDASNAQIEKLKDEIAKLQNNLNATVEQKQTLQNAINALNLNIQKLQKSITLTQTQIKQKDGEIGTLSNNISDTTGRIGVSQEQIADSLRQLEVIDKQPLMVTLLGGGTLSSFFNEAATLEALRTELQNHIHALASLKTNLEVDKNTAEGKRKELGTLNNNLGQQKQGLTLAKTQQTTLLEQTKNKERAYQALIAQKQITEKSKTIMPKMAKNIMVSLIFF